MLNAGVDTPDGWDQTQFGVGIVNAQKVLAAPLPATPPAGSERADDRELALATYRMRHAVEFFRSRGIEAEGEVGHPDPIHAVARALDHEPADELILSTLPAGTSHWLEVDVPKALERRFALPVKVLTAAA